MIVPPIERCPTCGRRMAIPDVALIDPQTPPWLCAPCGRAYWHAECSVDARTRYRPRHHDWGHGAKDLRREVETERNAARRRGCAVHEDLLPLVARSSLERLARRKKALSPDFAAALTAHLAGRKH